ncbi:MAG TPA: hypothetical protein VFH97_00480 [Gemmatimonadales bacterium]|nr:hypothetical protein [Gemmatimonadales bacterium]
MRIIPLLMVLLFLPACDRAPVAPASLLLHENTLTGDAQVGTSAVFPSTNEANYGVGWAHVLWVEQAEVIPEQVTLNFVSLRSFFSCFEYRIDDEPAPYPTNFNTLITDGMWNYSCRNNSSQQLTFQAADHVDVRMGFGAEGDERFDWTRFYVLSLENRDQCKEGQWEAMGFTNQGQCVRYVETGKDSRIGE